MQEPCYYPLKFINYEIIYHYIIINIIAMWL